MKNITKVRRKSLQAINRSFALIDNLFIVQKRGYPPPLFILGVPRSGTTLTYQVVTTQFDVSYFLHLYLLFRNVHHYQLIRNLYPYFLTCYIYRVLMAITDHENSYSNLH